MSKKPCPCCSCNPSGVDGCKSGLGHLTLEGEAHAHARWAYIGCPNSERLYPTDPKIEVRWFDKRLTSRGEAWRRIEAESTDKQNRWEKCHTARTWCWVRVVRAR